MCTILYKPSQRIIGLNCPVPKVTDCSSGTKICCPDQQWRGGPGWTSCNKIFFTATYKSQKRPTGSRYAFYEVGPASQGGMVMEGHRQRRRTISSQEGGDHVDWC